MAGPYLFVSPSLTPCPAVCLLPLFHLCCNLSIDSPSPTHTPSLLFAPLSLFGIFFPNSYLPFPFVLLLSFNLPSPALSSSSFFFFFGWHRFLFFFQLSLPFSSLSSLIRTPFSDSFPQLSLCCLFLLPQVLDVRTISLPLCFRRPHHAPHSRLLLMIKAKTSHQ